MTLEELISRTIEIADKRNLSDRNPIPVTYPTESIGDLIIVVSEIEPNNATLPLNVSWICMDETSHRYQKIFRRVATASYYGLNHTWYELGTLEELLEQEQYWDTSGSLALGEVDVPEVGAATETVRGLFQLTTASTEEIPSVVGGEDPRMSDKRTALPHTHAVLPAREFLASSGTVEATVQVYTATAPEAGQVLRITSQEDATTFIGVWDWPRASDIAYSGPTYDNLVINGPTGNQLDETVPFKFTANALFSDASSEEVPATWSIIGGGQYASIGTTSGTLQTLDVDEDVVIRVQATYTHPESKVTRSSYVDVTIIDNTVYIEVLGITINGSASVNENTTSVYTVTATFSDGTSTGVTPTTFVSSNNGAGTFDGATGVLTVPDLNTNVETIISASYTFNGMTVTDTLDVTCLDNTIYPESAVIVGSDSMDEGTASNYTLRVTYTDGTISDITDANWASDNEDAGTIDPNSGLLTAVSDTDVDLSTTISAYVSISGRTVNAEKVVYIRDADIYPQSAVINGQSTVMENSNAQYSFEVTWTDGSVSTVQVTDWALDNSTAGIMNISTGVLTTTEQSADDTAEISASYTNNGITLNATKAITVTDETIYVASARIIGDSEMDENDTQTLLFEVTYDDGSKVNKVIGDWVSSNTSVATVGLSSGVVVSAPDVAGNKSVYISGSFTENGRTVNASFDIAVIDTTEYITKVTVNGASSVVEETSETYAITVTYSSGRTATDVNPRTAEVVDAVGNVVSVASYDIASRTFTALDVEEDTQVRIRMLFDDAVSDYSVTKSILITNVTPVITAIQVHGPSGQATTFTTDEDTPVQFTGVLVYSDGSTTISNNVTWYINDIVSSVSGTGLFTPGEYNNQSLGYKRVQLTATYAADTRIATTVFINVTDTTIYVDSLEIVGSASVPEDATRQYSLEVTWTDGSVTTESADSWGVTSAYSAYASISSTGLVSANTVDADQAVEIFATYDDPNDGLSTVQTVKKMITVTNGIVTPVSATLSSSSNPVLENETAQLSFNVTWSDGSTSAELPNYVVADETILTVSLAGVVAPKENTTESDVTTTITGSFTAEGVTVTDSINQSVSNFINRPVSGSIVGVSTVSENSSSSYTFEVTWLDGTTTTESVDWSVDSTLFATISATGLLTTKENSTKEDQSLVLTGEFTHTTGDVVSDDLTIVVTDDTLYVSEVFITGPNELTSATNGVANQYTYQIWVRLSDDTVVEAVDDTYLDARPTLFGDVLADATQDSVWTRDMGSFIDDRTLETNPDVSDNGTGIRYGKIGGNYLLDGQSHSINYAVQITIEQPAVEPTLTVSGSSTANSNSTQQYTAEYMASDSTTSTVTPTWSIDDTTYASIDANGLLTTTNALVETDIVVTASYNDGSSTLTDSINVTIAQGVVLSSISASGASTVEENTSEQYTVTATYSDGSTSDVTNTATYSVSNASAGTFSGTTKGLFDATEVSADTTATLTFTYVEDGTTVTDTIAITITDVAVVEPTGNNNPRWGVAMFNGGAAFTGGPEGERDINYDIPYTQWTGPQDFGDSVMTNEITEGVVDTSITVTMGNAMYGYFAHRKADSARARFTDVAINIEGGWGGASWTPEGEIGNNFDPVEVMYDSGDGSGPQPWLFYRTDWDSNGTVTYNITFDSPA